MKRVERARKPYPHQSRDSLVEQAIAHADTVTRTEFAGERVRLVDLLPRHSAELRSLTFRNCIIEGPAVIVPTGGSIERCRFDSPGPEALLWDIDTEARPWITGAILVADCKFVGCKFECVGVAGPAEVMDKWRADFFANGTLA